MQSSIMGMDEAGMNTATYFMRDKIYSDKILAVIREYVCNAVDEHEKHKISKPVLVGLRNQGNSKEFYVRDFAKGLSEQNVRNIFGMYFRSTKSKSNDSIGGFGVGSKAGHCYTDTFFVTSHYEGVKSTYTCMLGGGDSGVPVGHIYKVDESPTNESGIEVSLEIKTEDIYDFRMKISDFISFSPFNISFVDQGDEGSESISEPFKQVYKKKVGKFNFRLVNSETSSANKFIRIQMGGVTYETLHLDITAKVKKGSRLIVDVPIGSMSIPISRESFEKTVSNEKILEEIRSIVKTLAEEDISKFKDKTIVDILNEKYTNSVCQTYVGDIFQIDSKELYSRESNIAALCFLSLPSEPVQMETPKGEKKPKPVLVYLPNANVHWRNKIKSYSVDNKINFYCIDSSAYSYVDDVCKDHFVIKKMSSLKFPKLQKKDQKYSVWGRYNKIGTFNADLFNRHMLENLKITIPDNLVTTEDFYKFIKEKISQISTYAELRMFSFSGYSLSSKSKDFDYYISSKILSEELKKFGWLDGYSQEYNGIAQKISKQESAKRDASLKIREAKKSWIIYNNKTTEKIQSNSTFAVKIGQFWQKILKEDSIRGKIFSTLEKSYAPPTLDRNEVRKILNLK